MTNTKQPKHRCQNCDNAIMPRYCESRKSMPMIICGLDPRIGWDRLREWGDSCDKWVHRKPSIWQDRNFRCARCELLRHPCEWDGCWDGETGKPICKGCEQCL